MLFLIVRAISRQTNKKKRKNYCKEATDRGKKRKSNTDRTNRRKIKGKKRENQRKRKKYLYKNIY